VVFLSNHDDCCHFATLKPLISLAIQNPSTEISITQPD
jgi:hypothetical protein